MSRVMTITLIASVLLLAVGVSGLAAYVFLVQPKGAAAAAPDHEEAAAAGEKGDKKEAEPQFFKTKNFVTDLADKDRLRYADVTVSLSMVDALALDAAKKIEPQIRDAILGQLRLKSSQDLVGAAGKERLAEELTKALQPVLKTQLKKVYITDLIVQ